MTRRRTARSGLARRVRSFSRVEGGRVSSWALVRWRVMVLPSKRLICLPSRAWMRALSSGAIWSMRFSLRASVSL